MTVKLTNSVCFFRLCSWLYSHLDLPPLPSSYVTVELLREELKKVGMTAWSRLSCGYGSWKAISRYSVSAISILSMSLSPLLGRPLLGSAPNTPIQSTFPFPYLGCPLLDPAPTTPILPIPLSRFLTRLLSFFNVPIRLPTTLRMLRVFLGKIKSFSPSYELFLMYFRYFH